MPIEQQQRLSASSYEVIKELNREKDLLKDQLLHNSDSGDTSSEKVVDPSQESYSWSEMAALTHEAQVEIFGWCMCEDNEGNENPYDDCPTEVTS